MNIYNWAEIEWARAGHSLSVFWRESISLAWTFCLWLGRPVLHRDGETEAKWDCPSSEPNTFPKQRREKKPHPRWWTTGSDYDRQRRGINNLPFFVPSWSNTLYVGVGLMFERLILPKKSFEKIRTLQRRKQQIITTKQANRPKSGPTATVNNGRLRQALSNLPKDASNSDQ